MSVIQCAGPYKEIDIVLAGLVPDRRAKGLCKDRGKGAPIATNVGLMSREDIGIHLRVHLYVDTALVRLAFLR